jgi:hypothetical protein
MQFLPCTVSLRPLGAAARELGRVLAATGESVGDSAAVSGLQRVLNRLGDEQVEAETPKGGTMARPKVPKLLVDGVLGPKTRQAARLALHQSGARLVVDRLQQQFARSAGRTFG